MADGIKVAIHTLRFSPKAGRGSSESLALLIDGFREGDITPILHTYYSEDNSFERKPCDMHEENFKGGLPAGRHGYLALQKRIARAMAESGADIHLLFGPSVMCAFINNTTPGMTGGRWKWYLWEKWVGIRDARKIDALIFDSPVVSDMYRHFGYRARSFEIVPDPIDIQKIHSLPSAEPPFTREPDSFHAVYAGRLIKDKGVHLLVEAARALPDSVVLHVVGSGNEEAALRHSIEQAGLSTRVMMHGWKPWEELIGFYRAADCFVHPSPMDTFGRAVAEALACGTPVITASGTGPAWVAGEGGITFKKGDAPDLAQCILRYANDPGERAARSKQALLRSRSFEAGEVSRRFIAIMTSLL